MIRVARTAFAVLSLSLATFAGTARAEVPIAVKAEIEHLLTYVGASGCEFYRNGSWYDGKKGAEHLQIKLDWLAGRNMIQATQDFIDKAATQSSMSSLAYQVRCNGGEPVASAKWLSDELTRFRGGAKKPIS
jgi:predicted flavoprotein YhiN